jgi:nitrogen-specific signal transduction histidine kinase
MTGDHEGVDPVIEGFTVDETLKVESQEHARLLQEELSRTRRLESITGLAAGVAHEFNNILQAMMGSAYLIQMMAENESSEWQYARDIQDSGTRAARLCEQMLTFAGKKNFTMEVATVDDVIRSSRTKLKSDLKPETSLQIHCRAPEAKVLLDPGSLTEVLVNLVKNAEESVEGREAALEIDTRVVEVSRDLLRTYGIRKHLDPKSYWGLFVSDNGEGITDDVRERMFDPFFTTKFAGRGLGLAAVLGILDKFDGVIGARSLPGSGTEVVVLLPLVSSKAAPDASKASSGLDRTKVSEEAASDWPEDCLVLIVDDEPLICQTIERFVVRWGLRTHSAFDGAEAMDWITHSEQKPHAILLDVTMPRMGGLETIQALNDAQLNIPVILMSGYDEDESRRQFQGYELAGFIHKPFQVESLKAELKRVLRSASS